MRATTASRKKVPLYSIGGIVATALLALALIFTIWRHVMPASDRLPLASNINPSLAGEKLIFDDEFNGPQLNSAYWNAGDDTFQSCCLSFGLQDFTSQALSIDQGMLHIASERRNMDGKNYTSGALTTEHKFSFLYGRVDVRARLPKGQGMWPALWLTSGNVGYEIDIMEMVNDPTIVYQTYHVNTPSYNTGVSQCTVEQPDLSTAFHLYSVVWSPSSITWYIDGVQTCQVTANVPRVPMNMMIDTAVGGEWPGPPDSSTVFPQYTLIDYVRIYQPAS